jgi:hypothetical protein
MAGLIALSALGTNAAPALEQFVGYPYSKRLPERTYYGLTLGRMAVVPSSRPRNYSLPWGPDVFAAGSRNSREYVVAACWEKTPVPVNTALVAFPAPFARNLSFISVYQSEASDLHLALYSTNALLDWVEIWWADGGAGDLVVSNNAANSTFAITLAPNAISSLRRYDLAIFSSRTNFCLTLSETNTSFNIGIANQRFWVPVKMKAG